MVLLLCKAVPKFYHAVAAGGLVFAFWRERTLWGGGCVSAYVHGGLRVGG